MSAIALLEALDRFLEVADATKFNRRRRQALIPIERELERSLAVAFKRQGTLLAKLLAKEKSRFVEAIEDLDWWEAYLTAAQMRTLRLFTGPIDRAVRKALLAGALHMLADTGIAMSFSLQNPRAVAWLQDYGAQRVAKIDETTRQYIKTVITEGVEHGWSYDQMARTIIERYREFAVGQPQQHIKSRAHLIAVTEVGEAYCEGNLQVGQMLQDAGFVMEKKWLTVGDDRVSAVCRGNEAQGWILLNVPFQSGHMRPLAHPACRCDLLTRRQPVVSEARRIHLLEYPGQPRDKRGRFAGGKGAELYIEKLGKINSAVLRHWPRAITKRVVLTGERRNHILRRHPEMAEHVPSLRGIIQAPNEVHKNAKDRQMAIFYQRKGNKYLRAAVWISDMKGKQNSVHSFRWAEISEVEAGRKAGRVVWVKK